MKAMTYKGYAARVEFDAEDRIFVGHVTGLRDLIGFHGTTVAALERAFHAAVDEYLAACARLGQAPEKPASGRVLLRLRPEIHARAAAAAETAGKSLNAWIAETVEQAAAQ